MDCAVEQYAEVLAGQFTGALKGAHMPLRQLIEDMPAVCEDQDAKYYSVFHGPGNEKFHAQLSLKVCERLVPLVPLRIRGVEKDPQKACACFKRSIEEENNGYAYDMMGLCPVFGHWNFPGPSQGLCVFFHGQAAPGGQYLRLSISGPLLSGWPRHGAGLSGGIPAGLGTKDKPRSLYVLGRIYCEGLGMPQDIAMGVEFLERSGIAEAKEERKKLQKIPFWAVETGVRF